MDIIWFLEQRLDFVNRFYDRAAEPFETTKQKIESEEEPFEPKDIESGEPEYLDEWQECEKSLSLLGQFCLSLVSASAHWYLEKWALRVGGHYPGLCSKLRRRNSDRGWVGMYRRVLLEEFHIDWSKSPVPVSVLEEIVLTRNDLEHNTDIALPGVRQSDEHFQRFPDSLFADDMEVEVFTGPQIPEEERFISPWKLTIDRAKLHLATDTVKQFCKWLEDAWDHWPPRER